MANWKDHATRAKVKAQRLAAGIRQKNRHAAVMNRLRTGIRCQEQAAEKEYLALGRYYYNALRGKDSPVAEEHCKRLDEINALLDATLKSLEETVRAREAAAIGIIGGADGPTAIYISDSQTKTVSVHENDKDGTLFHFGRGPIEITVTRDTVYHPEDENSEEIDLSDVESFDHDPMPEGTGSPVVAETPADKPDASDVPESGEAKPEFSGAKPEFSGAKPEFSGAELDENDSLPFEG